MTVKALLNLGSDRAIFITPIQAHNPYPWDKVLSLIQTCFAYMEARIDPPSSMHLLTVDMIAKHAETGEVWVMERDRSPIACVFLTPKSDALYVGKLAVSENARGKGLAKCLMQHAENRARTLGFQHLELETRIELIENHRAFEKMGFHKTAETAHDGYDRPTSITMQKELT